MVSILRRIEDGEAAQGDLDLLLDVCDRILGKCLCPLGDAAAMPVASYIDRFRDEFQAHLDDGCPMRGTSTLDDLFAPVDQHRQTRRPSRWRSADVLDRARHRHGRRPFRRGRQGARARRDRSGRRDRDPGLLLRASARPAGRRLPDVPRRGGWDPEAPGGLHPDGAGGDGRPHGRHVREGRGRPERDARVHPRQPSPRLPGLRQGRRVPAAGPRRSATGRARRG